jgi:hypothetical protein
MPSPLEIVQLYGGGKPVAAFARTRGGHAVPPAFWRTRLRPDGPKSWTISLGRGCGRFGLPRAVCLTEVTRAAFVRIAIRSSLAIPSSRAPLATG